MISEKTKGLILIALGFLTIFILAFIPTPEPLSTFQKSIGQFALILSLIAIVFGVHKIVPPRKFRHQGIFQIIAGSLMFIAVAMKLYENWTTIRTIRLVIDMCILFFMVFLVIDGIRKEMALRKDSH